MSADTKAAEASALDQLDALLDEDAVPYDAGEDFFELAGHDFRQIALLLARVRQEQQAMQIEMGRRIADRAKAEAALAATTQENESLKAQWSVMARACGNYRDFGGPVSAEVLAKRQLITDADYKAAAQAIVQLSALTSALEPLHELENRATEYLTLGGFFNPEAMEAQPTSLLIYDLRAAVRALLTAADAQ